MAFVWLLEQVEAVISRLMSISFCKFENQNWKEVLNLDHFELSECIGYLCPIYTNKLETLKLSVENTAGKAYLGNSSAIFIEIDWLPCLKRIDQVIAHFSEWIHPDSQSYSVMKQTFLDGWSESWKTRGNLTDWWDLCIYSYWSTWRSSRILDSQ